MSVPSNNSPRMKAGVFWSAPDPHVPDDLLGLGREQRQDLINDLISACPDQVISPPHLKALGELGMDKLPVFCASFVHAFALDKALAARCLFDQFGSDENWTNSLPSGIEKSVGTALLSSPQRDLLIDILSEAIGKAKKMFDLADNYSGPTRLAADVFEHSAIDLSNPVLGLIQQHDLLLDFPTTLLVPWLSRIRTDKLFDPHADWIDVSIKRSRLMAEAKSKSAPQENSPSTHRRI